MKIKKLADGTELRPLAEGEVVQKGDVFQVSGGWRHSFELGSITPEHQHYRPVRMQSSGWRYLDTGEPRPERYEKRKDRNWVAGCLPGIVVGTYLGRADYLRTRWPPREADKKEQTPPPLKANCVYCDEPDDETMGVMELFAHSGDQLFPKAKDQDWAHARCAQAASNLQPPSEPEPMAGPDLWGEEFEIWKR